MKISSNLVSAAAPDVVIGPNEFTQADEKAMQEFIAATAQKPENKAAVVAMQRRGARVVVVSSTSAPEVRRITA